MKGFYIIFLALQISNLPVNSEISQRIINGGNVNYIANFPHMVSLQRGMNGFWQHICGGAIIGNRAVLTAGSCVNTNFNAVYRIRAGILNHNEPLTVGQTINVQHYERLEENPVNVLRDIAVLFLRTPLNFTTNVAAVTLPPGNWAPPNPATATLTGWGATNALRPVLSERLQQAAISFSTVCTDFTTATQDFLLCSNTPTTGTPNGCTGDVGSPLVTGNYVIGILARYQSSCNSDMYTRVNAFRNWIDTTLSNNLS